MTDTIFENTMHGLGKLHISRFDPQLHSDLVYPWLIHPRAKYWRMNGYTRDQVREYFSSLQQKGLGKAYLGFHDERPAFLIETYPPQEDPIGEHYPVQPDDIGMHILVAPTEVPVTGFTRAVFQTVMTFLFADSKVNRVVVEPDANNKKIHAINKEFGFVHERWVTLPHKRALLGFCTRAQFQRALQCWDRCDTNRDLIFPPVTVPDSFSLANNPKRAVEAIDNNTWSTANRHLLRKMLSEFIHERLLHPTLLEQAGHFRLSDASGAVHYEFEAQIMALNHWIIAPQSINKFHDGQLVRIEAAAFIKEFSRELGLSQASLPVYLEEISSTLCSHAFKQVAIKESAGALVDADFQTIERSLTEGHPTFIANNGRIGFDAIDYRAFAPEAGLPMRLLWLAAHSSRAEFSAIDGLEYASFLACELDASTRADFDDILKNRGADPVDFILIPVHPWQWFNKLATLYAGEIADGYLHLLGYGDDVYQAQQSIRTFFNVRHPCKHYVKTALSILNMGFMRGLSSHYMRSTPAINQWVHTLVSDDAYLSAANFSILREVASVGYRHQHYEDARLADNPYKKMLAALWRESPLTRVAKPQTLMSMAALLHIDHHGRALLPELIAASRLSVEQWLRHYFDRYLNPLLHCFYRHKLVFMPHGENIILVMEHHVPVGILVKDIGEEVCLLNSDTELPENVRRITVEVPEPVELLSIFTDVFDGFFRYLAEILATQAGFSETAFWRQVANSVHVYQQQHPALGERFARYDIFIPRFAHSCLNRLQLRNNRQLIDLSDPAAALQFAGELDNPIAPYRNCHHEEINSPAPTEEAI